MARPKTFDEQQVLTKAIDVFRRKGFDGTSIPELTAELGICRQSLYNAFGDKRGLFLDALEHYGRVEVQAKLDLLDAPGSPIENLRTVIRGWAAMAAQCPGEGCFTITAIVVNRNDAKGLAIVEEHVNRLERGYESNLERALLAGELKPDAKPARMAHSLITSSYGIALLSRLAGSSVRIGDSVAEMLDIVERNAAG
ncbi:MAG: TetR/AcrR family transcriptional regulator [Planctomycetota bacterium]|nr:TetR/AcrR family transcriptional regulator [Planctomycetota bacterium]